MSGEKMKMIWKYKLEPKERQEINMPVGSRVLCVREIGNCVYLWVEFESSGGCYPEIAERRKFLLVPTGAEFVKEAEQFRTLYVGTVVLWDGEFVFHVYEEVSIHGNWKAHPALHTITIGKLPVAKQGLLVQ